MAIIHGISKRKITGGVNTSAFTKRLHALGRSPSYTKVGKKRITDLRVRGGASKKVLLSMDVINVYDPAEKKHKQLKIKSVVESPANRNFVKRNIITKGSIVETEEGRVKVTSRPGQESYINGILLKK